MAGLVGPRSLQGSNNQEHRLCSRRQPWSDRLVVPGTNWTGPSNSGFSIPTVTWEWVRPVDLGKVTGASIANELTGTRMGRETHWRDVAQQALLKNGAGQEQNGRELGHAEGPCDTSAPQASRRKDGCSLWVEAETLEAPGLRHAFGAVPGLPA